MNVRDVRIAKKKKISPKHSVLSFWQKYLSLCFHPSSNSSFTFLTLRSDVAKIFVSLRFCILPEFGFLTFRSDFSHAESPHHPAHSILLPFWEFAKYIQSGSNNIKYKVEAWIIKWPQQHLIQSGPPIPSTKWLKEHLKYKRRPAHSILLPFWEFAKYIQSGSNNIKYKVTSAVYNIKWNQQHFIQSGPPIKSTKSLKDHLKYKLALIHQHHKSTD